MCPDMSEVAWVSPRQGRACKPNTQPSPVFQGCRAREDPRLLCGIKSGAPFRRGSTGGGTASGIKRACGIGSWVGTISQSWEISDRAPRSLSGVNQRGDLLWRLFDQFLSAVIEIDRCVAIALSFVFGDLIDVNSELACQFSILKSYKCRHLNQGTSAAS